LSAKATSVPEGIDHGVFERRSIKIGFFNDFQEMAGYRKFLCPPENEQAMCQNGIGREAESLGLVVTDIEVPIWTGPFWPTSWNCPSGRAQLLLSNKKRVGQ
jgi:hypothetical protein